MKGLSHADVERICLDAIKTSIIEDKEVVDKSNFDTALKRQKMRLQITRQAYSKKVT
jgi:AAA+ superfamily predicted ATPase